ncbi:type II toxin-antitoxin system VapC family toxin [Gordonia sp. X0973]|uniref:type II toxin-antitoxin system VapC family toxin n=1 Tax=Gordonia sp. X0973 TaxID=2742602 RepID=UPI000F540D0D|nr:type II toxin-antitoxin system VapC family toxin [Gordonia sp. X0973]QKT06746.1 type II toxin-antitoxin system VapC family toxin [Gordonia sp. X0973]
MRYVVDASVLVDAVLPTERQSAALTALQDAELWAPTILDLEVTSTLWRLERTGQITDHEAGYAVDLLRSTPIRRVDDPAIAAEAWQLRKSIQVADAFYVATARLLDAALITRDARLSRAPRLGVTVVLLP